MKNKKNDYIKLYLSLKPVDKMEKLKEEAEELLAAILQALEKDYADTEAFDAVLDEFVDVCIVVKQLSICRYDIELEELESRELEKIDRSLRIIREMNITGKSYDMIRYGEVK